MRSRGGDPVGRDEDSDFSLTSHAITIGSGCPDQRGLAAPARAGSTLVRYGQARWWQPVLH
jgi:hypothetical protein